MNTAGTVALCLLAYGAGLGSYWLYVIVEWYVGKKRRTWWT